MNKSLDTKKLKRLLPFKKYNYNVNEVIGVKNEQRYILYADKKLIRIYRGNLVSSALLSSYIPVENAIFYNFKLEKSVLDKIDLDSHVETRVFDEAGVDETDAYFIKYKIVDKYNDPKYVVVETVIVSQTVINEKFKYILNETGYIDYLSFPAFGYRALYAENILKKANDIFAVVLFDKIFLTFYSEGELVYISTLSSGLDKVYETLEELKIRNFNMDLFIKLITKKGVDLDKYSTQELAVLEIIKKEFSNIQRLIFEQVNRVKSEYKIGSFDRLFITTEYGEVLGLKEYLSEQTELEVSNFEFSEKYNLDRLPIDPFLFLAMLETHYAYKNNDQKYNFSPALREPTFFYRPSGKLFLVTAAFLIFMGALPLYEYIKGFAYERKNSALQEEIVKLKAVVNNYTVQTKLLSDKEKSIRNEILKFQNEINTLKKFIDEVYKFKYSYIPKSQEMVDITQFLNRHNVYVKKLRYNRGAYTIKVYSYNNSNIPDLINDLTENGFDVYAKEVVFKNGRYNSELRIKE